MQDYEKESNVKDVVRTLLTLIWASRSGMFQTELVALMESRGVHTHQWEPALLQCEDLLLSAGGLLNFANRDIQVLTEPSHIHTYTQIDLSFFFALSTTISNDERALLARG